MSLFLKKVCIMIKILFLISFPIWQINTWMGVSNDDYLKAIFWLLLTVFNTLFFLWYEKN